MYARVALLSLVLAVCHAFPQHAGSYSSFGYGGGHGGGYGGYGGGNYGAGFGRGIGGGYGGYGYGQQSYVAAVAPVAKVAVAPVAKYVAPVVAPVVVGKQVAHVDHYAPPHYQFEYAVKDEHTGDVKSQHEEREGDNTRGYYTVNEPDGTVLTVHYTVDKHSGFQAVVERTGHAAHPQAVKKVAVVAPVVHHAPILHHAPVVHAAPYVQSHHY